MDQGQVHRTALKLPFDRSIGLLSGMLANAAFEAVKHRLPNTPVTEVFRHVRNAASHDNRFFFRPVEPSRPASWRTFALDHALKGPANPLHGVTCFQDTLGVADLLLLLHDIEQLLP
jgi:hypothetical protein